MVLHKNVFSPPELRFFVEITKIVNLETLQNLMKKEFEKKTFLLKLIFNKFGGYTSR